MVQAFMKGQSIFVNYSCFQMSELQISRTWIRIVFSIWLLEGRKLQNPITEWKKGVHVLLGCDWVRDGSDWAKSLGTTDSTWYNGLNPHSAPSISMKYLRMFSLSAVLLFNLFKLYHLLNNSRINALRSIRNWWLSHKLSERLGRGSKKR